MRARQPGAYVIRNLVNGREYIGSSVHVPQRWREHLSHLRLVAHPNRELQADWLKFGSKAFSWTVVKECSRNEAIACEQQMIDSATVPLYNASRRAGSGPAPGYKHKQESIAKMSAALKGKPKSLLHRARLGDSKRGVPNPNHSARLTGKSWTVDRWHAFALRYAQS